MPKAKKVQPYIIFVKERYPELKIELAVEIASREWEEMSPDEKAIYKEKAKNFDIHSDVFRKPNEKCSSQGIPLSTIDKETNELKAIEEKIQMEIEDIIHAGRNTGDLADINFNFAMVNYFSISSNGAVYLPAEIAFASYTINDGIKKTFHSLINPGITFFGHGYNMLEHTEKTHQLSMPPNAAGETDLLKIFNNCLSFVCDEREVFPKSPTIFTLSENIKAVEGVLNFLQNSRSKQINFQVYPLNYLFYTMKRATSEISKIKIPNSIHITNALLDRDIYEYQTELACQEHDKKDRSKYCALSCVIRWGYTLSDNLCFDLGIKMHRDRHMIHNADETTLPETPSLNETQTTLNTYVTQPNVDRSFLDISNLTTGEKFNKNFKSKTNDLYLTDELKVTKSDEINNNLNKNPWSRSERNKNCRDPTESSFSIDFSSCINSSGRGLLINEPPNKIESFEDSFRSLLISRGRGVLYTNTIELPSSSKGRGLKISNL